MKTINPTSPLTLGIVAIFFGLVLFYFGKGVLEFSVLVTGLTLITIAVIQQITITKAEEDKTKPVLNTVSVTAVLLFVVGILLVAFNEFWVKFAMTLVGVIILLLAVAYIMQIIQAKKVGLKTSAVHYILFIILVASSILILTKPNYIANFIMELTGGIYIICGILELSNYFTLKKMQKQLQK